MKGRIFGGAGATNLVLFQKAGILDWDIANDRSIYQKIEIRWFILSSFCDGKYAQGLEPAEHRLGFEVQTA